MTEDRTVSDVATRLAILAMRAQETGGNEAGARMALEVACSIDAGDMRGAAKALSATLGRGILKQLVDRDLISGVPASQVVEDAYRLICGMAPALRSPIIGREAHQARELMAQPPRPTMSGLMEQMRDARQLMLEETMSVISPHVGRVVHMPFDGTGEDRLARIAGASVNADPDRDPIDVTLVALTGPFEPVSVPASSIPEISGEMPAPDRFYLEGSIVSEAEFRAAAEDSPEPA